MHTPDSESIAERLRAAGAELAQLLRDIEQAINDQHDHAKAARDVEEMQRLADADPFHWIDAAKASLKQGFMFANRALTQPTDFF